MSTPFEKTFLGRLYEAQRGGCFYCLRPMDRRAWEPGRAEGSGWTRDHVYPKSGSGKQYGFNVVLACRNCNNKKGSREPTRRETDLAREIYALLGLRAFVTKKEAIRIGSKMAARMVHLIIPPADGKVQAPLREVIKAASGKIDETKEPKPPALNNETSFLWKRAERYAITAGIRIENRVPICVQTLDRMMDDFTKARAAQLEQHFTRTA